MSESENVSDTFEIMKQKALPLTKNFHEQDKLASILIIDKFS